MDNIEKQPDEEVDAEQKPEKDYEALLSEKDKQIEEVQKELAGLKNKEFNFKKLRDMTESERSELTEKEKELMQRQDELEENQKSFTETVIQGHKNDALAVLAGDDKDLRDKIEYHYNRISDKATTKEDINKKVKDAYLLATGGRSAAIDQISRAVSYQGGGGIVKSSDGFSSEQKELASRLGITEEDLKKYNK